MWQVAIYWPDQEEMELDVNDLEKEFRNLKDKNGNAIRYLYAAKGL